MGDFLRAAVAMNDSHIDDHESTWASEYFSTDQLRDLAKYLHVCGFKAGRIILQEGDRESHMCMIAKGKVRIVKETDKGEPCVIATLDSGKAFGELSIIDGQPRSASVIADDDTTLFVLTKAAFDRLRVVNPSLAVAFYHKLATTISQRLRLADEKLVEYLNA